MAVTGVPAGTVIDAAGPWLPPLSVVAISGEASVFVTPIVQQAEVFSPEFVYGDGI